LERDPKAFLWDAREAAALIAEFTAGKLFADFNGDKLLRSAVERQFEIIGEALGNLAKLDPVLAAKITDLREAIAFRNILVHGYAAIDNERVWRVIERDLPRLEKQIRELLSSAG
jgi:uncharacterized protein with HEPN domain